MESVCSGFMFRTRSWRAAKDGGYEAGLKSNVVAVRPAPVVRVIRRSGNLRRAEMPVMRNAALQAARAHGEADASRPMFGCIPTTMIGGRMRAAIKAERP